MGGYEDVTLGSGGMDWRTVSNGLEDCIELAHDRDRWQALVNAVMNFRVP